MNNNLVITLERQFGSGGYEIGKKVAEKLGIPCYNKEILETAAERINIPEEYLESMQENVSQSLLYKLSLASQNGKKLDSIDNIIPKPNLLYNEISAIIKDMANKGSCMIIGRCADFILREFEPCFHVFIYAPMESRKKRVIEGYGISADSAEYIIRKNDKRRESFYNGNTGHTWGLKEHYNLCLNSGKFTLDQCADIIIDSLKYVK